VEGEVDKDFLVSLFCRLLPLEKEKKKGEGRGVREVIRARTSSAAKEGKGGKESLMQINLDFGEEGKNRLSSFKESGMKKRKGRKQRQRRSGFPKTGKKKGEGRESLQSDGFNLAEKKEEGEGRTSCRARERRRRERGK